MVMTAGLGDLASFFLARTRAQTAADASALAAAAELIPGIGTDPLGKADEFASANGAELVACDCSLGSAEVVVTVAVPVHLSLGRVGGIHEVKAHARAQVLSPGPASP
jgi:secretion/DNA translocation related TadE-like protein